MDGYELAEEHKWMCGENYCRGVPDRCLKVLKEQTNRVFDETNPDDEGKCGTCGRGSGKCAIVTKGLFNECVWMGPEPEEGTEGEAISPYGMNPLNPYKDDYSVYSLSMPADLTIGFMWATSRRVGAKRYAGFI